MKMLEYTFQHLEGFGDIKEKELRRRKIFTWDDYEKAFLKQLNFSFFENTSLISESRVKLI